MGNRRKRRFKVRGEDGRIRTVSAQSHRGTKLAYAQLYGPEVGYHIVVWPMDDPSDKRNMRITKNDLE